MDDQEDEQTTDRGSGTNAWGEPKERTPQNDSERYSSLYKKMAFQFVREEQGDGIKNAINPISEGGVESTPPNRYRLLRSFLHRKLVFLVFDFY